jgi:hypothetical protein
MLGKRAQTRASFKAPETRATGCTVAARVLSQRHQQYATKVTESSRQIRLGCHDVPAVHAACGSNSAVLHKLLHHNHPFSAYHATVMKCCVLCSSSVPLD